MATIKRYSFSCPHCHKEIASSWGDASYSSLPDAFLCRHCGQVVTLSPDQRLDKMADQQSSKGFFWILLGSILLAGAVAYIVAKEKAQVQSQTWLVIIVISLIGGFLLAGLVGVIRKAVIYDRLKAESKREKA